MSLLAWLFWGFATIALIAGAFILHDVHIRPGDLSDDDDHPTGI